MKELQGEASKFTKDSEGTSTGHRGRSSFLRPLQVPSATLRLGVSDSHTIVTALPYRTAFTVPARLPCGTGKRGAWPGGALATLPAGRADRRARPKRRLRPQGEGKGEGREEAGGRCATRCLAGKVGLWRARRRRGQ